MGSNSTKLTPEYLSFPFRMETFGAQICDRTSHVRQQIEQVLFTNPNERVFRPEFGAGLKTIIFEPNATALQEITKKRLIASLAEALREEVDPKTLEVDVSGNEERLYVSISYSLASMNQTEQHEFTIDK